MYSERVSKYVSPKKFLVNVIRVGDLGHYLNFNDIVTSEFVHEMVEGEFGTSETDYVIFVPVLALQQYLMDMLVSVTTDAVGELSRGHVEDYRMLVTSSLDYWREALDQFVRAVEAEAEKGKIVKTIVVSDNQTF
jgi:hypothetical protein